MKKIIAAFPIKRSSIFPFLGLLILVSTGLLALCIQEHNGIYAAAGDVSGAPTLPASTVDQIFAHMGSPMVGTGKTIVEAARATRIDDAFALAVWWTETNDGEAGVGLADRNPGSVRGSAGFPTAYDGYTIYPSYDAAIIDWFNLIRNNYLNRGYTTPYTISGPYVGTAGAPQWAAKVVSLLASYQQEAPPPLPSVTQGPTSHRLSVAANEHRHSTHGAVHSNRSLPETYQHHSVREWNGRETAEQPLTQSQHLRNPIPTPQILMILQEVQVPLLGSLLALTSLTVLVLALHRRRTVHSPPVVARQATEQLLLQDIKNAMPLVPPTPHLFVTGNVPLTPFIHVEQSEMDTEGFAFPRHLRPAKHGSRTGIETYKASTEALPRLTGSLSLPDRVYSEAGTEAQGLILRFGDKNLKNPEKNC
jgi:hypothetical protein